MTLSELLEAIAADLGAAGHPAPGGGLEWRRGERTFAALQGGTAEFRLAATVADAARRTPDTGVSPRGRDWVAFSPGELDPMAEDRAAAWFASAWRYAAD
jgi:hypothetical protein